MKACRICLAVDIKVFRLGVCEPKYFIESIFKQNGFKQDLHESHYVCYECKALLNKSYNFIRRVLQAQDILYQMQKDNAMLTPCSLMQINRSKIGMNLVRDFRYNIDIYVNEDGNRSRNSIKKEMPCDIEFKVEDDDSNIPDPLENALDEEACTDLDMKQIQVDFGQRLQFDYDPDGVDSEIDMKISCFQFNINDAINQGSDYASYGNNTAQFLYEYDDSMLSELVKQENISDEITNCNERSKKDKAKRKKMCIKKEKQDKAASQCSNLNRNCKMGKIRRQKKPRIVYGETSQLIEKPEAPKYPHKCQHCSYEIPNRRAHFHHYLLEHKDKKYPYALTDNKYVCQFCGVVSKTKWRHQNHEFTHSTENNFPCPQCPKSFVNKHRLQKHTYRSHPVKMFECDYCGKKVKSRESLMIHIRIHTGERPFKCPFCGAGFAHRGNIRPHIRANHEQADTATDTKSRRKIKYEMKDLASIAYEPALGKLSGSDLFMNTVFNKYQ